MSMFYDIEDSEVLENNENTEQTENTETTEQIETPVENEKTESEENTESTETSDEDENEPVNTTPRLTLGGGLRTLGSGNPQSVGSSVGSSNTFMSWDGTGKRFYENGVDHGILFVRNDDGTYGSGIPWNGLTTVTESPEGAEANDLWADNMKYATLYSNETFSATIEAYMYPDEFGQCDGSYQPVEGVSFGQQTRRPFAFCYRTHVGNDAGLDAHKLHIVYNCQASPSEKSYETINDSPDAITFSWEVSTTPMPHGNIRPVSTIVIDESKLDERGLEILEGIERMIYGDEDHDSELPTTDYIAEQFGSYEGNPVTFEATKATRLSGLKVNIEPVQDLHGYDNPWPAGGTPQRYDAVTNPVEQGTISSDNGSDGTSDSRIRTSGLTAILPSTTYYFSYSGNALQAYIHYYDSQQAYAGNSGGWINKSSTTTFTTPSGIAYARFVFRIAGNDPVTPSDISNIILAVGTDPVPWTPYSNICPISGHISVSVTRTGKNRLPDNFSAYSVSSSYTYLNNVVPEGQTARFTFVDKDTTVDISSVRIGFQVGLGNAASPSAFRWALQDGVIKPNVSNISQDGTVCTGVFVYPKTEAAFNAIFARYNVMVELGSEATEYVPYAGSATSTITFPSPDPDTVYFGELDLVTGVLKAYGAETTISSASGAYLTSANRPRFSISGMKNGARVVSDRFATTTDGGSGIGTFYSQTTQNRILFNQPTSDSNLNSLDAWTEWFTNNPTTVVYELATPVTYQLTGQQVNMLSVPGTNVVMTDNGNTLEIVYREDAGSEASSGYTKQQLLDLIDPNYVKNLVKIGIADKVFDIGDQFNATWNDGTTTYDCPFDVVHFGKVINEYGVEVNAMYLQSHWAIPGVQFDASEAIYYASEAMAAGTYYFTIGTTWSTGFTKNDVYAFTTTQEIPAGGQIVIGSSTSPYTWGGEGSTYSSWKVYTYASKESTTPIESVTISQGTPVGTATDLGTTINTQKYSDTGINNLERASRGYNRWSQSAVRQWLNSDAAAGSWWTAQNNYDRPPEQLSTVRGFKAGLPSNFLELVRPMKVTTALNTVSDSDIGISDTVGDLFSLASLEQEYCAPQLAGVEGEAFTYWVNKLGTSSPQAFGSDNANTEHIRQSILNHESNQTNRLRSANRDATHRVNYININGAVVSISATTSYLVSPICVVY